MMRNSINSMIFLFAAFFVATLGLTGGLARQAQALGLGVELAQGALVQDEKVHVALGRIDDLQQYRKISDRIVTVRAGALHGIADLAEVLDRNLRYFCLALVVCLFGLFATGVAMYLRLLSYERQLAHVEVPGR